MTIVAISASLAKAMICDELDTAKVKVVGKSDDLDAIHLRLPRRWVLSGDLQLGQESGGFAAIQMAAGSRIYTNPFHHRIALH